MYYPLIHKTLPNQTAVSYSWFESMHSRMDILLCGPDEQEATRLTTLLADETDRLENLMNRFNPGSLLAEINTIPAGRALDIPQELAHILATCREWHQRTQGLFDITIQSPTADKCPLMDFWELTTDHTVIRHHPDLILDLCGFAKGYAVDACKELLLREGIQQALINFGNSSVLAIGNQPYGHGWLIGMGGATKTEQGSPLECTLHDQCLTTSGNNTHHRQHLIRPDSRHFVTGKRHLSVITENGTIGEILSTALFIANEEEKACISSLPECLHIEEYA